MARRRPVLRTYPRSLGTRRAAALLGMGVLPREHAARAGVDEPIPHPPSRAPSGTRSIRRLNRVLRHARPAAAAQGGGHLEQHWEEATWSSSAGSSLSGSHAASREQRELYRSRGYVVIKGLIPNDQLRELSEKADRILDGELRPSLPWRDKLPEQFGVSWEPAMEAREDLERRARIRFVFGMARHDSFFREFNRSSALCGIMASLFESSGVKNLFGDQLFCKPPNGGVQAAMHQDTAFWPQTTPTTMNLWVAIDPATKENGCLHVIPGSHRHGVLPHRDDPVQSHIIDDSQVDMSQLVAIEMDPGDALFMDSGLVHRSYDNHSQRSRRAIGCVFGSADMELTGEEWREEPHVQRAEDFEAINL
jgi:phytanoyl-CoA hydroxylase